MVYFNYLMPFCSTDLKKSTYMDRNSSVGDILEMEINKNNNAVHWDITT